MEDSEGVDCLIDINDFWKVIKRSIARILTIKIDPIGISNEPIRFKGSRHFGGYTIVSAPTEYFRRIVHWFYRNVDSPSLEDWFECMYFFNLNEIPTHILQLYNHDYEPLNKFILIHNITNSYIHYTYENKEEDSSITVTVPLGIASLVPERFLFNLNLYSTQRNA